MLSLRDFISCGNLTSTKDSLDRNPEVDLLEARGSLIRSAIESTSTELVKYLLDYFHNNQLSKHEVGSDGYHSLIYRMKMAVDDVKSYIPSGGEMRTLLEAYILEDSSESDADPGDEYRYIDSAGNGDRSLKTHNVPDTNTLDIASWINNLEDKKIDLSASGGLLIYLVARLEDEGFADRIVRSIEADSRYQDPDKSAVISKVLVDAASSVNSPKISSIFSECAQKISPSSSRSSSYMHQHVTDGYESQQSHQSSDESIKALKNTEIEHWLSFWVSPGEVDVDLSGLAS